MNPDLSAFIAHGGKLIATTAPPTGLDSDGRQLGELRSGGAVAKLGDDAIKDRVKLYLVPGNPHPDRFGGEGAFAIDWLSTSKIGRQKGKTPGALPAMHPAVTPRPPGAPPSPAKAFTRRCLCLPASRQIQRQR